MFDQVPVYFSDFLEHAAFGSPQRQRDSQVFYLQAGHNFASSFGRGDEVLEDAADLSAGWRLHSPGI